MAAPAPVAAHEESINLFIHAKFIGMDMDQRLGWLWDNCRETYDTAKEGLRTNYYGTKHVIESMLPLLQASSDGRIVNVSSHFGQLRANAVEEGGWPKAFSAYKVAKAAMNAYSRILARRHPELRFNCAHPGHVRTDMTIYSGFLTPEEGGSRVVAVAMLPKGSTTGSFFEDFKESSFM
ncbi:hypothetical protein EJB05_38591, partial [Eragrostis curvula]